MKTYKPKSLIKGYKLGLKDEYALQTVFAVPFQNLPCKVEFKDKMFELNKDSKFIMDREFDDKFREGETYTLRYFGEKDLIN